MIDLQIVKNHLRIFDPHEDELLELYMESAKDYVKQYCNTDFNNEYPKAVELAMLQIIGGWYDSREEYVIGASVSKLPLNVDKILNIYRLPAYLGV